LLSFHGDCLDVFLLAILLLQGKSGAEVATSFSANVCLHWSRSVCRLKLQWYSQELSKLCRPRNRNPSMHTPLAGQESCRGMFLRHIHTIVQSAWMQVDPEASWDKEGTHVLWAHIITLLCLSQIHDERNRLFRPKS